MRFPIDPNEILVQSSFLIVTISLHGDQSKGIWM